MLQNISSQTNGWFHAGFGLDQDPGPRSISIFYVVHNGSLAGSTRLSLSHVISWCVRWREQLIKRLHSELLENCSLITLRIALFSQKAAVECSHFYRFLNSEATNSLMKSPWWCSFVPENHTHTHTQKHKTGLNVMSYFAGTHPHPSPSPFASPSILEARTDPGLHLGGWLPSTSTSFYENKSQLDVQRFREEAKNLIKT